MEAAQTYPTRIHLLEEQTVNRIAAGEVVERPASVVKELVENSIDAGARAILIEVEQGGKRLIRVTDDGEGMSPADALLSIQRHATSKIRSAEDLHSILTLGFRGEALPSIAAVSRFEMLTKRADLDTGMRLVVEGGQVVEAEECAARNGTAVTVRDLFYNTPARLKFLKSVATELSHITELVTRFALAFPEISFRLLHNGQEIFASQGGTDPRHALLAVFGREVARELRPIEHSEGYLRITGYVSPPHLTRPTRSLQSFFVNRRIVRHRVLSKALDDAYRTLTPEGRHPIAALFLHVPPHSVDVNVHPTKAEVKFAHEGEVYHAVFNAVRQALLEQGMIPSALPGLQSAVSLPQPEARPAGVPSVWQPAPPPPREVLHAELMRRAGIDLSQVAPVEVASVPRPYAEMLEGFEVLGQLHRTYIIASSLRGLLIIDQHVAHERVLYEKLTVQRQKQPVPVQHLLTPLVFHLDRRTATLLGEHLREMQQMGFLLEPFGADSVVLRGVPAWLGQRNAEALVRDLLDEISDLGVQRRLPLTDETLVATTACKMAVKAGDALSHAEMTHLLQELAETENPYLCPHGRPVVLVLSIEELERRFKRA
ncbi:MAG: DNA mismatch repair endonuclease MutL [Armatimonadota bacterium]|nr:DNA mismatch repair endonuclease MutL [Armatimonadota bacterium]